jgi:hypothetical protein
MDLMLDYFWTFPYSAQHLTPQAIQDLICIKYQIFPHQPYGLLFSNYQANSILLVFSIIHCSFQHHS